MTTFVVLSLSVIVVFLLLVTLHDVRQVVGFGV